MKITLVVFMVFLVNGLFGWLQNQPKDIGLDVPEGKLVSLSFAPFRQGQSPLKEIFPSPQEIDEDLRLMAERTLFALMRAAEVCNRFRSWLENTDYK